MKVIFTFIMIAISTIVNGQTITIGTGTANTLYGPIYIFSNSSPNTHSWNLTIYDQSEIIAAGGQVALINMISWYKTDTSSYPALDATFQIYMKHTPMVEFTTAANFDTEVVGATLVYDNSSMGLTSVTGWTNFNLTPFFNWNGTDNIMILTRWSRVGNATGPVNWQATNTTPLTRVSHSFNSSSTMGTLYTSGNRPNIQLGLTTGVNIGNESIKKDVTLFPNPTKEYIIIDEINSLSEFTLTDLSGRIVFKQKIPSGKMQKIKFSFIKSGIYKATLTNPEMTFSKKIAITD